MTLPKPQPLSEREKRTIEKLTSGTATAKPKNPGASPGEIQKTEPGRIM